MPNFRVSLSQSIYYSTAIEADNEAEARERALEQADNRELEADYGNLHIEESEELENDEDTPESINDRMNNNL